MNNRFDELEKKQDVMIWKLAKLESSNDVGTADVNPRVYVKEKTPLSNEKPPRGPKTATPKRVYKRRSPGAVAAKTPSKDYVNLTEDYDKFDIIRVPVTGKGVGKLAHEEEKLKNFGAGSKGSLHDPDDKLKNLGVVLKGKGVIGSAPSHISSYVTSFQTGSSNMSIRDKNTQTIAGRALSFNSSPSPLSDKGDKLNVQKKDPELCNDGGEDEPGIVIFGSKLPQVYLNVVLFISQSCYAFVGC